MLDENHNVEIEVEVVYDIIQINNDRSAGYIEAVKELNPHDEDLKTIFNGMAHQSANYKTVLLEELQILSMDPENSANNNGKIYQTWKGINTIFGHDRQSVLNFCKAKEDAVMEAYKMALSTAGLSLITKSILESQQTELRAAQNHINVLRGSVG